MTQDNSAQIANWNTKSGVSWSAHQDRFAAMLAPFRDQLIAAAVVRAGEQVLDIGCGSGDTVAAFARLAGPGCVTGVDVSEPLLAQARAATQDLGVELILADASHHDFGGKRFDLLASKFGVMFFADPGAAFARLGANLHDKGRLAAVAWRSTRENEAAWLPFEAARDLLPPLPPADPEAPGPFSFGDRDRVLRILKDGGFRDIAIEPFDAPLHFGAGEGAEGQLDDAVDMAFHLGPLRRLLDGQSEAVRQEACARVRTRFSDRLTPDGVILNGAAWLITATV